MADKVLDVVCKMMVDPDSAPAKTEYQGKTYYFCAPGCKVAFEKDPKAYVQEDSTHAYQH